MNPNRSSLKAVHRRRSIRFSYMFSIGTTVSGTCLLAAPLQLFAIKLGATEKMLGLLSFVIIAPVVMSLLTLNSIEKHGKRAVMIFWNVCSFLVILPIVLLPLISKNMNNQMILYCLIFIIFLRSSSSYMGSSGWFPILHDNVPKRITSRYFASMRSIWQGATFLTFLLVGWFMGKDAPMWKLSVTFSIGCAALLLRVVSPIWMYEESPTKKAVLSLKQRVLALINTVSLRPFLLFCLLFNLGTYAAVPFQIKLLKELGYSDSLIMYACSMVHLGAILTLRLWGRAIDRHNGTKIFGVCILGMAVCVFSWIFVGNNSYSAVLVFILYLMWSVFQSGYGIAQIRYLFHNVPQENQQLIVVVNTFNNLVIASSQLFAGVFLSCFTFFELPSYIPYKCLFLLLAMTLILPIILLKKLSKT